MRNYLPASCLLFASLGVPALSLAQTAVSTQPPPPATDQSQTGKVQPIMAPPVTAIASAPATPEVDLGPSIHGFADVALKNFYATPRGLLVTDKGETLQVLDGLVLDFPQPPSNPITDVSFVLGTWTDFNPGYESGNKNVVNEFDWFTGFSTLIGKEVKAGVQYVEFDSPQRAFHVEHNVETSLSFDDSAYLKPISIQPYIKLFFAAAGSSTVVTGRKGKTFDVEIGAVPKLDLHPYGVPLILTAPTWFTVGPKSYWGDDGGNLGVFSTGLKATYPLTFIPASWGGWYADTGIQYYHIINNQLLVAQTLVGTAQPGTNEHRNFGIWSVGFGMSF
jgi:hypothetical protein